MRRWRRIWTLETWRAKEGGGFGSSVFEGLPSPWLFLCFGGTNTWAVGVSMLLGNFFLENK